MNQHFETISVLPTRRIFKNRGPSRRYQVAQNHKAQEKLGSSSTKAQRHEAGHRLNTASQDAQKPLSSATKSSTHEVRSSKPGSSQLYSRRESKLRRHLHLCSRGHKLHPEAQLNEVRSPGAQALLKKRVKATKASSPLFTRSQAPSGGSTQRSQKPGSSKSSSLGPT